MNKLSVTLMIFIGEARVMNELGTTTYIMIYVFINIYCKPKHTLLFHEDHAYTYGLKLTVRFILNMYVYLLNKIFVSKYLLPTNILCHAIFIP